MMLGPEARSFAKDWMRWNWWSNGLQQTNYLLKVVRVKAARPCRWDLGILRFWISALMAEYSFPISGCDSFSITGEIDLFFGDSLCFINFNRVWYNSEFIGIQLYISVDGAWQALPWTNLAHLNPCTNLSFYGYQSIFLEMWTPFFIVNFFL